MAGKPTTCKEALKKWEEENQQTLSTAVEVNLNFQWPPIEKMDNSLSCLSHCQKLSLSTNMIEKIAGNESLYISLIKLLVNKYLFIIFYSLNNCRTSSVLRSVGLIIN